MMTLLEFCEKFRVSHKKAKLMLKAGVLRVADVTDAACVGIIGTLTNRSPLSALELSALADNPALILSLGRFAGRAQEQLDAIGDATHETAPIEIVAAISDAARGDPVAVDMLATWIKSILPAESVSHAWIACRLLLASPTNLREFDAPRIPRALSRVRKLESFADWFTYEKRAGRNVTLYARPNSLASLDL
jgi:hypothetical protein